MRILLQTVAEAGGEIPVDEGYEIFLGKSLAAVCDLLRRDYGIDMDAATLERMRERLYKAFREELRPIPGVAEVLQSLSEPICVASSSQPERIALALETTGLTAFFGRNVFSASMVKRSKPAPDLFLHAARQMQADPANCLVIEDSPAGISAAQAAGMAVFGFAGGSHAVSAAHRERLQALSPLQVFDDMCMLPSLVQALDERLQVP